MCLLFEEHPFCTVYSPPTNSGGYRPARQSVQLVRVHVYGGTCFLWVLSAGLVRPRYAASACAAREQLVMLADGVR